MCKPQRQTDERRRISCRPGSVIKLSKMQNTDGRLILTAEVTKHKIAKTSKIYLNKFARYFGLQHKPSSAPVGIACETHPVFSPQVCTRRCKLESKKTGCSRRLLWGEIYIVWMNDCVTSLRTSA